MITKKKKKDLFSGGFPRTFTLKHVSSRCVLYAPRLLAFLSSRDGVVVINGRHNRRHELQKDNKVPEQREREQKGGKSASEQETTSNKTRLPIPNLLVNTDSGLLLALVAGNLLDNLLHHCSVTARVDTGQRHVEMWVCFDRHSLLGVVLGNILKDL